MSSWTCSNCGALGSEFDAQCAQCGDAMPAMSVDVESVDDVEVPSGELGWVIGGYRVLGRIGAGGMGLVYKAVAPQGGGPVAVKVLAPELAGDAEARARFRNEARAAASVQSPHIVRILDHGLSGAQIFIVMELLEGEDLGARLARRGRLSVEETTALVHQAAAGLGAAHAAGIVHRDLKPENVFFAQEAGREIVKLLDFGIAKGRAVELSTGGRTRTGELLGTPHFMSPEQADGTRAVDHRSDLWSLAVIAYRCLTGRLPFESPALGDLLMKIMSYPLPVPSAALPTLPRAFDGWWRRAADRHVAARFASAAEMSLALEAALSDLDPTPAVSLSPISMGERRFLAVVLLRSGLGTSGSPGLPSPREWESLAAAAERHGGRLERLTVDTAKVVLTLHGASAPAPEAPTDLAVRAARYALAAQAILPGSSVALVTGRGDRRGGDGELQGLCAELLTGPGVRAGKETRHLLLARFDLSDSGALHGERDDEAETCTLLHRPVPFVGRTRELATLGAIFDETEASSVAQAAIVLGAAGVGKSRLRQELLGELSRRARRPAVWLARGDAGSAGSPFGMISRALRREAGIAGGEPLEASRAKLGSRFGLSLPEESRARTLAFLGELCSVPFPSSAAVELAAARESPRLMGDHIHRAFEDLVSAEVARNPLVLVLEDLHWGDRPSIELAGAVLRNLPDTPLFVLALGRPETTSVFPGLWSERRLETLHLGDLLPRQSEELVLSVLGALVSAADLDRMVDRAAGNAFFLQELVRAFAEGERDGTPETVLAMVGARIERLDPAARRLLQAASAFGQSFWIEGARALLGGDLAPGAVDEAIDACVRRELLVRRRTSRIEGCTEIAFRHALVRDAARAMVADDARAAVHLRVAEWLESAGEHDMAVLAEHFERGGDAARAVEAYRRASAQALEGNDFATAIDRAEAAVAAGAQGEALGLLRSLQAEAHGFRDEHGQAKARGDEAMRLLAPGSAAWCAAALDVARASASQMEIDDLVAVAEQVRALDPSEPRPHHLTSAARIVTYLCGADRPAEAGRLLERAEQLVRHPGAAGTTALAWLHHARAWTAFCAGDAATSLRGEELSVLAFERAGDERNACYIRVGLGHAYREVGALAEAEQSLREALRTAERLGLTSVLLGAKYTLSSVLCLRGSLPEAVELARAAVRGFDSDKIAARIGGARTELAQILAASGDLRAAEAEADGAQRILEGLPSGRAYALAVLARVRLLAGEPAEALLAARAAVRIVEERGGIAEGEVVARLALALALRAAGDPAADAALAAARACVMARADRIGDAALRKSFLENLPENAETLALTGA